MSLRKTILTAAVVVALGTSGAASAADDVPYSAAPAALCGPCVSQACTATGLSRFTAAYCGVKSACPPGGCDTARFPTHKKEPYVVNLCPGGCFGYFPTQWRKWDDLCPPQVIGEMPPPIPHLPGASDRTPPRVVDPKTGLLIPAPPGLGTVPASQLYPGLGGRY